MIPFSTIPMNCSFSKAGNKIRALSVSPSISFMASSLDGQKLTMGLYPFFLAISRSSSTMKESAECFPDSL
ncbi:MAG: hypothetical protein M1535_05610 [Candidatus Thermoplasmatota archaeon]|nr:hypothetical protein [Candidatus Thermoplasmatota archaeon]